MNAAGPNQGERSQWNLAYLLDDELVAAVPPRKHITVVAEHYKGMLGQLQRWYDLPEPARSVMAYARIGWGVWRSEANRRDVQFHADNGGTR